MSRGTGVDAIRCYSCGKVLGNYYDHYDSLITGDAMGPRDALNRMGLLRIYYKKNVSKMEQDGTELVMGLAVTPDEFDSMVEKDGIKAFDAINNKLGSIRRGFKMHKSAIALYKDYILLRSPGRRSKADVMDILGITRMCCRGRMLSKVVVPLGLSIPYEEATSDTLKDTNVPVMANVKIIEMEEKEKSVKKAPTATGIIRLTPNLPKLSFTDEVETEDSYQGIHRPVIVTPINIARGKSRVIIAT